MHIQGIQKLTLLDWPGRVACTVFTGGCNLRCPFCHNASIVLEPEQSGDEEALRFLSKRQGLLEGVCVSGGEPMLQKDLEGFLGRIKELGFGVKLDTNGFFPQRLEKILKAGLVDYVAMDIKNSPRRYGETAGIPGLDIAPVEASVRLLMEGETPYEFRTTVVRGLHTPEDMEEIGQWIRGAGQYYLQQFVDSGGVMQAGLEAWDQETMETFLRIVRGYVPAAQLRGI